MKKMQRMIMTATLLGCLCFAACGGSEESPFDFYEDEYDSVFDTNTDYDDTWDRPVPTNTPQPTATPEPTNTPGPTATPEPTPTPTPLVNPTVLKKIEGQRWMPNIESYGDVLMVVKEDGHLYTMGKSNYNKLGYLADNNESKSLKLCLENILIEK